MYSYFQLILFLVSIEKFDQNSSIHPWLTWAKLYKSQIRPKQGENLVANSHELYYIVSMYKYNQLTLLQVLIEKCNQSQTFSPDWPELGHIRAE